MSESVWATPERRTDSDGTPVDVFALPADAASLEALFRDLFERHWEEIVFGPIIQGAAFEIYPDCAPTRIGLLDGYLTVAFGRTHFHVCIGETKGPRSRPTSPELARHRRTARAELHRRFAGTCVPMSWSLQLFNGAGEQQLTVLLPNPFLDHETGRFLKEPDWSRLALWDALRARWLGLRDADPVDRSATRGR
ncbi:MAG TPA: hypothetical protein VIF40_03440 [Methylosinus sp.]|jgi:hypothetical protein|uniref:DUF7676 family protein n=1 Tax=Methylosinus sp. TaxID=427 RepID=UPI002F9530C4